MSKIQKYLYDSFLVSNEQGRYSYSFFYIGLELLVFIVTFSHFFSAILWPPDLMEEDRPDSNNELTD